LQGSTVRDGKRLAQSRRIAGGTKKTPKAATPDCGRSAGPFHGFERHGVGGGEFRTKEEE
jgi:hypothetical protein